MLSPIYKTFDIVVVPFPFVDAQKTKNRPALVISTKQFNQDGNSVLMMITSALHPHWYLDTEITDLKKAGLEKKSVIRTKLFTIDNRLIKGCIGSLSMQDQVSFSKNILCLLDEVINVNTI